MKTKQMTERQREATRANGARSSGPITAQGKYNSSRNIDALKEEHQPRTTTEVLLVESMAVARWRQTRVWGAQERTGTGAVHQQARNNACAGLRCSRVPQNTAMDRDMAQQDPGVGPAGVRVVLAMRPSTEVPVELLLRYEAMFERQFARASRSLKEAYSTAMMMAPTTIRRPPTPLPHVKRSPKNRTANTITRATLNLSIGATLEAGPTCKA